MHSSIETDTLAVRAPRADATPFFAYGRDAKIFVCLRGTELKLPVKSWRLQPSVGSPGRHELEVATYVDATTLKLAFETDLTDAEIRIVCTVRGENGLTTERILRDVLVKLQRLVHRGRTESMTIRFQVTGRLGE